MAGHYKRATSVGLAFSVGNTSGLAVGQVFRAQDEPRYLYAVRVLLGFTVLAAVMIVSYAFACNWVNKKRDEKMALRDPAVVAREAEERTEITDFDETFRYNL